MTREKQNQLAMELKAIGEKLSKETDEIENPISRLELGLLCIRIFEVAGDLISDSVDQQTEKLNTTREYLETYFKKLL